MSSNVSELVRGLAEQKGISQATIAKSAGVTRSAVSKWFNGTSQPSRDVLQRLAILFGVPIAYFYEDDPAERLLVDYPEEYWDQEVAAYELAAGQGRINDCQPHEYIAEEQQQDDYSYARVHGDSMLPALEDGDVVKVHHQTETAPSDYTVVKINGDEATIKHVEIVDNGVWLRAENKEVFPDKFYTIQEVMSLPVQVIGKAVEIRREL